MMNEMSRAVNGSAETVLRTNFGVDFVEIFIESTMQSSMRLLRKIAEKREINVADIEVLLTFVKSGYMLSGYIQTLRDANLGNGLFSKPGAFGRRLLGVDASDRFEAPGEKMNSSVHVAAGGEKGERLWAAMVLLLFKRSVIGDTESLKYVFL